MSLILFALVASANAKPLLPAEQAVITNALASYLPTKPSIANDPVSPDAPVVCGRVNGKSFMVTVTRNATGRIVGTQNVLITTPEESSGLERLTLMKTCFEHGYYTL